MEPPRFEVLPPEPPQPESKGIMNKIWGWIVAIGVAFLKFKFFLFAALKTSLSMILMIVVYTVFFGWKFAVGIVFMIFVHEMGHVLACLWYGVQVRAMMFIPFIGAYVQHEPGNAWLNAKIAYGGPLAGAMISWAGIVLAHHYQADWIMALASVSFLFNMINMIPVPPLDGGSICAAVSPWFWFLGMIALGFVLIYFNSWITATLIIVMVCFITLPRIQETFFGEQTEEMQEYYATHLSNRLIMALLYLILLAALVIGYEIASGQMRFDWNDSAISTLGGWLSPE